VIQIHPNTSVRELGQRLRSSGLSDGKLAFVTFQDDRITGMLSAEMAKRGCPILTNNHLSSAAATTVEVDLSDMALTDIANIVKELPATTKNMHLDILPRCVPLLDVPSLGVENDGAATGNGVDTIISWTSPAVPVQVNNVDQNFSFRPNGTYVLFGLSGQLGKSITTWMVRHGARHVVLTSRRPSQDDDWVGALRAQWGADVQFRANDITDRSEVASLLDDITANMPPIIGVANGAMVLQDTPWRDMSLESLERVFGPKVDGSRYLDELLRKHELDFFIFFSSLATVFGNHGQSNYTAANMHMSSIVRQRRQRGQAASIMAVGAIMGIGYMTRELTQKEVDRIVDSGYHQLSERDLHQHFCETVLAGKPDSGLNPEVICGVRVSHPGDTSKRPLTWLANPTLGHCIVKRETGPAGGSSASGNKQNSTGGVALKPSLLEATTKDAVFSLVKEAFVERLQALLQSEKAIPLHLAADELGVDSLVAVDIRSWFLKELQVDMPVLKILGGASTADMLEFAVENMPTDLTPNVSLDSSSADDSTASSSSKGGREEESSDAASNASPLLTPIETPFPSEVPGVDSYFNDKKEFTPITATKPVEETPVTRSEIMSFGQSRFWFLQHYLEDKTAFNIASMIKVQGRVRVEDFRRAVRAVGQHHEALRTKFWVDEQGRAMQSVLANSLLSLDHKTILGEEEARQAYKELQDHVYDLEKGETMRISLLSSSSDTHYLLVGYHHINMDGISLGVLFSQLETVYRGGVLPKKAALQYPDFAIGQRAAVESGAMQTEIDFWKKEFATLPPRLPLMPFSKTGVSRQPLTHYQSHKQDITVPATLASQIKAVAKQHRVSPFHIYLATFRALLARLTGSDDLVIGMADANRSSAPGASEAVGMFLNLLPLRFQQQDKTTFADQLKEARTKVLRALAHSRLPFDTMLTELQVPREPETTPLFQAFIDYRPPVQDRSQMFGCRVLQEDFIRGDTAYDVGIDIIDNHVGEAAVQFTVPTLLYSAEDVRLLASSFIHLLDGYTKLPAATVGLTDVPLYDEDGVKRAVELGRGPVARQEWGDLVSHIHHVMEKHESDVAVRDGFGSSLTYQQLNDRTLSVSKSLFDAGVRPGSIVTVLQEPTINWAVSVLSILRLGAVYVPIDARLPPQRIVSIVTDSQPIAMLYHPATKSLMDEVTLSHTTTTPTIARIDVEDCAATVDSQWPLEVQALADVFTAQPDRPAFILYTSGSTGVPKGVVLKQSGIANQVEATVKRFASLQQPGSTVLQHTAYSFDIAMWQLLVATTSGSCLFVLPAHQRGDPVLVSQAIGDQGVTFTAGTPSEYTSWLGHGDIDALREKSSWTTAITLGEAPSAATLSAFRSLAKTDLSLVNAYGPCEGTFVSHLIELDYNGTSVAGPAPIGPSYPNTSAYIVDHNLNVVPVGYAGQLALGGSNVALGYLHRKEETEKVFVPNPFSNTKDDMLYLTGDRAWLREDGVFVFASRLSGQTQIKIRGMRFDLQDVEANIIKSAGGIIADAIVSLRSVSGSEVLIAHVTFAKGRSPSSEDSVQGFFRKLIADLPLGAHMKPTAIIPLDQMPLTLSSKIDRAAVGRLPIPSTLLAPSQDSAIGVLSDTERTMEQLWRATLPVEVLKLNSGVLGPQTDFFSVGGHSILLANLQGSIRKAFPGVNIPLVRLFQASTLGGMAALVSAHNSTPPNTSHGPIDWEAETQPPVISDHQQQSGGLHSPPRRVILTGATGFLGRALLAQLVADSNVERVDCIAVRNLESLGSTTTSDKVHVYRGDLTSENLGLSQADLSDVFSHADAIVHNGADVSFLKSYHSLRGPNVEGTRRLVAMAIPRRIPFHFVSTAGVAHLVHGHGDGVGEVSVAEHKPPTDGSDGYVASKWAAEVMLERVNKTGSNLPVWVHRPSSVLGEGIKETDLMGNLLRYSLEVQALPSMMLDNNTASDSSSMGSFLDLVDVQVVTKGIVERVTSSWTDESGPVKYEYHSGDYVIPLKALQDDMSAEESEAENGFKLKAIPLAQWIEKAKAAGMNELVVELLNSAVEGGAFTGQVMFPRLVKGSVGGLQKA